MYNEDNYVDYVEYPEPSDAGQEHERFYGCGGCNWQAKCHRVGTGLDCPAD